MVMQRLRKFALRKRRPNPPASQLPTAQSRHSFVEEIAENKVDQDKPSSIQPSKQNGQDNKGTTSQTSDMATQTDIDMVVPPQRDENLSNKKTPRKKHAAKRATKKAAAMESHLNLDSLLASIDTVATSLDAASSSGLAVSQRLNDTAREILEAQTVMNKVDEQTTQLTAQMEMMQLRFNSAHVEFRKAAAINHSVFEQEGMESQEEEVLADMLHRLQVVQESMEKECVEKWPTDKVNQTLASLDKLHEQNKSIYNFEVVDEGISGVMEHFFGKKIHIPWEYQHLWLVGVDALEFGEQIRKEDHDFTNTHKAVVPKSDITDVLAEQRFALRAQVLAMTEPQCTSIDDMGASQACSCPRCQSGEAYLDIFCEYFFRQLGDEMEKKVGGQRSQGMMTLDQGAKQAMKALGTAYLATFSPRDDLSALTQHPEELNKPKGEDLTDMEKVALAHVGTCVVCKQTRVVFLGKMMRRNGSTAK